MRTPSLSIEEYRQRRRAYYARFPEFWATFPGGTEAEEEYGVYGALGMSRATVASLRLAAERLFRILVKVTAWAQVSPDDVLLQIGVPAAALRYARLSIPGMPTTVVGRFEFGMTRDGPKLLELNAETPTLIVELFRMNQQVCEDFGLESPNTLAEDELRDALLGAVEAGLRSVGARGGGNVVFTSYGDHQEDRETVQYLRRLLPARTQFTTSYCPLDMLRLTSTELRDHTGRAIDVLYKLYPTEHLLSDQTEDRVPIGRMVMGLVEAGRLAVINPPVSFLLQTKGLLALTWALHEAGADFLDADDHRWIESYMLPTYLEPTGEDGLPIFGDTPYVAKPVYGREGGSIVIHRGGTLLEVSADQSYADQRHIYQQHVPLPRSTLLTEKGLREVNLVFNCFIVGGHASAVGIRAGPTLILDDNAYFVPVCYEDHSPR